MKYKDLTGQVFGRWIVLSYFGRRGPHSEWLCKCACGTIKHILRQTLIKGQSKSCGCLRAESKPGYIAEFQKGTEFQRQFVIVWAGMRGRESNKRFIYYAGRGITVCDRWLKFENFRDDMWDEYYRRRSNGETIQLDRWPNVNGNYEPGNVRWATPSENMRNRRCSTSSNNFLAHLRTKEKIANSIRNVLFGKYKFSKYEKYLGCTFDELKKYIESQFESWMTWDNHGPYNKNVRTWHLDHIIPCYKFDFTKEEDIYTCFNYKNLRPFDSLSNITVKIR
jgi:hypothetical protein